MNANITASQGTSQTLINQLTRLAAKVGAKVTFGQNPIVKAHRNATQGSKVHIGSSFRFSDAQVEQIGRMSEAGVSVIAIRRDFFDNKVSRQSIYNAIEKYEAGRARGQHRRTQVAA